MNKRENRENVYHPASSSHWQKKSKAIEWINEWTVLGSEGWSTEYRHVSFKVILATLTREPWNTGLCSYLDKKERKDLWFLRKKIHTIPWWKRVIWECLPWFSVIKEDLQVVSWGYDAKGVCNWVQKSWNSQQRALVVSVLAHLALTPKILRHLQKQIC